MLANLRLMSVESIGGEKDGAVKCIRQATVATTDLHSNDHQLGAPRIQPEWWWFFRAIAIAYLVSGEERC
jgi:hypothetical protein